MSDIPGEFTIRRAQSGDLKAIALLWEELQRAQADAEPRLLPKQDAAAWFRDFLRDQMDTPGMAVFVAVRDPSPTPPPEGEGLRTNSESPLPSGTPSGAPVLGVGGGYSEPIVGYTFGQVMRRPTLQSGDIGYVADLCVHEGFRGRGLGRALFHRLRSWFIGQGVRALEVQTVRANPAAQAFWRKMGFDDFLRTLRAEL